MKEFEFYNPTRVIFGNKSVEKLGKIAREYGQRCLIASVNGDVRFDGTFTESAALIIPTSTANKFLLVTKDAIETAYLR